MTPYVLVPLTSPVSAFPDAARFDVDDLRLSIMAREDRPRILSHLTRLSDDDRRMRFMKGMTGSELEAFVEATELAGATRMGWLDPLGELVALCEGFAYSVGTRSFMELAFSTDAAWRRHGLARRLFAAMARRAKDMGIGRLELHCDSRNTGMRSLLRAVDAQTCVEKGEVDATWSVPS